MSPLEYQSFPYGLFASKKKEGEQGKGRENNSITLFGSFFKKESEGFGGLLTTSNPSFLIPKIEEIWKENRVDKLLTKSISQSTSSKLTKLQTDYINNLCLFPKKI